MLRILMTLKTSVGGTEIKVPRDHNSEFEPQLVRENQTSLTGDIEEKILSMYVKGMTTSDIESHIQEIYGLECSDIVIQIILHSFNCESSRRITFRH